jgi:hypothetical protein
MTDLGEEHVPREHRVRRYRPDPDRSEWDVRAYCTGCRWRWDGIGSFEHAKTEHENLNQP